MKSFNPLHHKLPDLQRSKEVEDAVEKHTRLTGEKVPNTAEDRLDVYMERLENIFLNGDEEKRARNIEMVRDKLYDAFIIKHDDVPESYFDLQKRVLRERGQHVAEIDEATREQMIQVIIEDQKKSLDSWIDYLSSSDAVYPTWFKYFVFRNVTKLSQFDKELGKFKERTKATTAPFPDIYREALAQVADLYESAQRDKTLWKDKDFQEFISKKFPTQYAEKIQATLEHSQEDKEQIKGIWVKYNQGDEEGATKLYKSLENKGTGWCTAGHSTAKTQIESGDFYVFYSYDKENNPSNPRLAIRMNGKNTIGEVRGILQHQEVEPILQDVLDEKLSTFGPEADKYTKKSSDMKRLTAIEHAINKNTPLTPNDLRFLYEIDTPIEGFGYDRDPRIAELLAKRNRREDIQTLYNCEPQYIAHDFVDITETTQVYCEDTKEKITLIDFREEKSKAKLSQLLDLAQKLKEVGSPARPDFSFEGGFVHIEIDQKTQEALRSYDTATTAYEAADNTPTYIYDALRNIPWRSLSTQQLDILVCNDGSTTATQRDKLVEVMDKIGYRPLEFSELVALGILKPEYNKRYEVLNTYKKYSLGGFVQVPYLGWGGGKRWLSARAVSLEWSVRDRFLFVCK